MNEISEFLEKCDVDGMTTAEAYERYCQMKNPELSKRQFSVRIGRIGGYRTKPVHSVSGTQSVFVKCPDDGFLKFAEDNIIRPGDLTDAVYDRFKAAGGTLDKTEFSRRVCAYYGLKTMTVSIWGKTKRKYEDLNA